MTAVDRPAQPSAAPRFWTASSLAGRIVLHLIVFAALIGAWEAASAYGVFNEFLVPRPSRIGRAIWRLYVTGGTIYWHFAVSLYETIAGFLAAVVFGVSLAVASAVSETFRRYIAPYAVMLNVTPALALTPIVIAWFGFGWSSKIALAAIISFFPIFVNTLTGLLRTDADRMEMFRSLGATNAQVFWKLRLPSALPTIFAGLKIGMTTALVGVIVAEFTQATEGVGVLMNRYSFQLDMASAIATLLSMSLMGLLLFTLTEILDDRIVFWRRDARMTAVARRRASAWRDATADTKATDSPKQ